MCEIVVAGSGAVTCGGADREFGKKKPTQAGPTSMTSSPAHKSNAVSKLVKWSMLPAARPDVLMSLRYQRTVCPVLQGKLCGYIQVLSL